MLAKMAAIISDRDEVIKHMFLHVMNYLHTIQFHFLFLQKVEIIIIIIT